MIDDDNATTFSAKSVKGYFKMIYHIEDFKIQKELLLETYCE
jgi:hypothetical protein